MACPPAALTRATVSRAASSIKSATARRAPSRAKARAVARPMPPPPPVISADFPSSNPAIALLLDLLLPALSHRHNPLGYPPTLIIAPRVEQANVQDLEIRDIPGDQGQVVLLGCCCNESVHGAGWPALSLRRRHDATPVVSGPRVDN